MIEYEQGWYWMIKKQPDRRTVTYMPVFLYIENNLPYVQWYDTVYQVTTQLEQHFELRGPITP